MQVALNQEKPVLEWCWIKGLANKMKLEIHCSIDAER